MSISKTIRQIEPDKIYNLSHITGQGLFPWARNIRTVRKVVNRDHQTENMLRTVMTGEGRALDYKIKGKNIIKFLEKYGPGLNILTIYKNETKKTHKEKESSKK